MNRGIRGFVISTIILAILIIVFVFVGGGDVLKSVGEWISGTGGKADQMKGEIQKKTDDVREKAADKLRKKKE